MTIDPEKLEAALTELEASSCGRLAEIVFAAARAHLSTLPRVKEVEVTRWRVEWASRLSNGTWEARCDLHSSAEKAYARLADLRETNAQHVHVSGPFTHKQRVPA